jgi:hypothetical protein
LQAEDSIIKRLNAERAELLEALKVMCQEFRALDLPYGSEAYTQAITAINKAGGRNDLLHDAE